MNAMWWRQLANWVRGDIPSPGQRYRAAGRNEFGYLPAAVWEVERVVPGADGIEYARLVRTNDCTERKHVSLTALANRSLYEPV